MQIKIQITMDNAAFADGNAGRETASILLDLQSIIYKETEIKPGFGCRLFDSNGNEVGNAKITRSKAR